MWMCTRYVNNAQPETNENEKSISFLFFQFENEKSISFSFFQFIEPQILVA